MRIFGWLAAVIVVQTAQDGKIDPVVPGKPFKHTQPMRLPAQITANRIAVGLQFLSATDLWRVSFEVSNTVEGKRYLSAYFDEPLRLSAGKLVRLTFRSEGVEQLTVTEHRH